MNTHLTEPKRVLLFHTGRTVLIVLVLMFTATSELLSQKGLKDMDAKLDTLFSAYGKGVKPGVAITILERGRPAYFRSYGYANLEYSVENTNETLFNAADLAKQFTIFGILLLREEGKLSLTDDVRKYVSLSDKLTDKITLRHLMEQTSGLRDVVELKKWNGYRQGDVVTRQEILSTVGRQKALNFPPGSKFEYNRTGFVLLSEVIAKVAGIPFSAFIEQEIFAPLGMHNSTFVNDHNEVIENRAYGYTIGEQERSKLVNNSSFLGGTNLYVSTADFAMWLDNFDTQKIGKPAFYEYLQSKIRLTDGTVSNYTPGLYKDDREGYWLTHLEGFDHGFTGYMMRVPKHGFSMVYFSNDANFPIGEVHEYTYEWFNEDYSNDPVPPYQSEHNELLLKTAEELRPYTGGYVFEEGYIFREVVLENDTLYYVRDENNRTAMVPVVGEHSFKMLIPGNDNFRVLFKAGGDVLEFRALSAGENNDYVTSGRKVTMTTDEQTPFSGDFMNDEGFGTVSFNILDGVTEMKIDGFSTVLDPVAVDEFVPRESGKVKYVKARRDKSENIIGVYLSGFQLRDIYYEKE